MSEFIQIGYTQKTHGVEGELRIFIEEAYVDDFLDAHALFIEMSGGKKVPYFIEYIRGANSDIMKLEDIGTKEEAQKLSSCPIFLRVSDLVPEAGRENAPYAPQYEFLEGYEAWDETRGLLGAVVRVDEYPRQEMAVVRFLGREVLIPLQEPILVSIDEKGQKVRFDLPEGLLEL